jgi:hypothetical protein
MNLRGTVWLVLAFIVVVSPQSQSLQSWGPGLRDWVLAIAIDPRDTSRIYASSQNGIHLSTDRGMTWTLTNSLPAVTSLVVDPNDSKVIYAASYIESHDNSVFKSEDSGLTWKLLLKLGGVWALSVGSRPTVITVGAGYGDIGAEEGLFQSLDGGATWIQRLDKSIYSLSHDERNPNFIFAAGWGGFYKTTDGGTTWRLTRGEDPVYFGSSVTIHPLDPNIVYGSTAGRPAASYKSGDAGETWRRITPDVVTLWKIVVDRSDVNTAFATQWYASTYLENGVLRTTDGGATWSALPELAGVSVWALAIDPQNSKTMYAGTGSGVWRSIDGGLHWNVLPRLGLTVDGPTPFCVGASWTLRLDQALPNSLRMLYGISNGQEWDLPQWGHTDAAGVYTESGNFGQTATGSHRLRASIDGFESNRLDFTVVDCAPK